MLASDAGTQAEGPTFHFMVPQHTLQRQQHMPTSEYSLTT